MSNLKKEIVDRIDALGHIFLDEGLNESAKEAKAIRDLFDNLDITVSCTITITAKKWFQSSAGNTYHSVEVSKIVGDHWEVIDYKPYNYGYGDHYLNTAAKILGITEEALRDDLRENRTKYAVNVQDVSRKRDL